MPKLHSFDSGEIYWGDCLEIMPQLPSGSIDMILCDLPYGTSACSWDFVIPFDQLWPQYKRLIKENGAIVLTASQPFTSRLINSNLEMFKYEWIWRKSRCTGYFDVQYRPMKEHENILVFGYGGVSNCSNPRMKYTPQNTTLLTKSKKRTGKNTDATCRSVVLSKGVQTQTNFPKSILEFKSVGKTIHPTQKPVELFEYLIRTYTDVGDTILDNCAGSFTTAIAAKNAGRRFVCIEKDVQYYAAGQERIEASYACPQQ